MFKKTDGTQLYSAEKDPKKPPFRKADLKKCNSCVDRRCDSDGRTGACEVKSGKPAIYTESCQGTSGAMHMKESGWLCVPWPSPKRKRHGIWSTGWQWWRYDGKAGKSLAGAKDRLHQCMLLWPKSTITMILRSLYERNNRFRWLWEAADQVVGEFYKIIKSVERHKANSPGRWIICPFRCVKMQEELYLQTIDGETARALNREEVRCGTSGLFLIGAPVEDQPHMRGWRILSALQCWETQCILLRRAEKGADWWRVGRESLKFDDWENWSRRKAALEFYSQNMAYRSYRRAKEMRTVLNIL